MNSQRIQPSCTDHLSKTITLSSTLCTQVWFMLSMLDSVFTLNILEKHVHIDSRHDLLP